MPYTEFERDRLIEHYIAYGKQHGNCTILSQLYDDVQQSTTLVDADIGPLWNHIKKYFTHTPTPYTATPSLDPDNDPRWTITGPNDQLICMTMQENDENNAKFITNACNFYWQPDGIERVTGKWLENAFGSLEDTQYNRAAKSILLNCIHTIPAITKLQFRLIAHAFNIKLMA